MELDYVKLKDLKPVLAGYIRESQVLLKRSAVPGDKEVHDLRVLMKKSRSVLKLAGNQLNNDFFKLDVLAFREVGQITCSWRDTSVHRKTLKELRKEYPEIFSGIQENEKLKKLMAKPEPVMEASDDIKAGLEKIDELLSKSGYRIRFHTMNKMDPSLLLKELESTYIKVSDAFLTCRNNPKSDNFHEFRKKIKDFLYQLYFFRPLNAAVIKSLEKRLFNITQNLGKFNDYTQLIKELDYKYHKGKNIPAMDELIVKIRDEQDRYLTKVWPSAYKIFCPGQKLVNILGFKVLII